MDNHTPEQRRYNMRRIKSKNTGIELMLRQELYKRGYRYRVNYKLLPGKPDIAFTKYKVAVFCDSEFFHGYDWNNLREKISAGNNPSYWIEKISTNINHDKEVNAQLKDLGWTVVRFWGKEISNDVGKCADAVGYAILEKIFENDVIK